MIYNFKDDDKDININLSYEAIREVDTCDGAIVIPFYKTSFVMTYHPRLRRWKFPEGIIEENETVEKCAIREAYEEAGAIADKLIPIGYYVVNKENLRVKIAIYVSNIEKFEPKPRKSETDVVKLFNELPKDTYLISDVYKIILKNIDENLLST